MKYANESTIRQYFLKLQDGELGYREVIILNYLDLVSHVVYKATRSTDLRYKDDYIGEGMIGLIKAVDTYDVNKNIKFITYAVLCIERKIIMFQRKNNRHDYVLSLNSCFSNKDGEESTFLSQLEDEKCDVSEECVNRETINELMKIISTLDERNKNVIKMYFGINCEIKKEREIANILGISRSYVAKIIYDSLKIIRERYNSKTLTKIK